MELFPTIIMTSYFCHKVFHLKCCKTPRFTHAKGKKRRTEHKQSFLLRVT